MSADKIQPPGLDDRFCPACGGRDLEFMTAEELQREVDEFDPDSCFIVDGKIAWRCNACRFESDSGGIPTLRQILEADDWQPEDVNVARLVRWAVEAMRAESPAFFCADCGVDLDDEPEDPDAIGAGIAKLRIQAEACRGILPDEQIDKILLFADLIKEGS